MSSAHDGTVLETRKQQQQQQLHVGRVRLATRVPVLRVAIVLGYKFIIRTVDIPRTCDDCSTVINACFAHACRDCADTLEHDFSVVANLLILKIVKHCH